MQKHNCTLLACRELRTSLFRISFIVSGSLTLSATGHTKIKKGKATIHHESSASVIEKPSSGEGQQSGNSSRNKDLASPPAKKKPLGRLVRGIRESAQSIFRPPQQLFLFSHTQQVPQAVREEMGGIPPK